MDFKKYRLIVSALFLLIAIIAWAYKNNLEPACNTYYQPDKAIQLNGKKIEAEVPQTESAREKGLGERECIGKNQGMLFVFNKPDYYQFWMKDMKFPIDIVWINQNKQVVTVKSNVAPSTYPNSFGPDQPAKYVLELKANATQNLGITSGTQFNW